MWPSLKAIINSIVQDLIVLLLRIHVVEECCSCFLHQFDTVGELFAVYLKFLREIGLMKTTMQIRERMI